MGKRRGGRRGRRRTSTWRKCGASSLYCPARRTIFWMCWGCRRRQWTVCPLKICNNPVNKIIGYKMVTISSGQNTSVYTSFTFTYIYTLGLCSNTATLYHPCYTSFALGSGYVKHSVNMRFSCGSYNQMNPSPMNSLVGLFPISYIVKFDSSRAVLYLL